MLVSALFALVVSSSLQDAPPFMRFADIHGDTVVFTSEGDLWLGDLASGKARRLTTDDGAEMYPRFSPDGSKIAFMAEYDGVREAYVVPTAGGTPKRLTYHYVFATVQGWDNTGTHVVYRTMQMPEPYDLKMVPASGGAPVDLPTEFGQHVSFSQSAPRFAFTRFNRATTAWFHYIGGMQNQIWTCDLGAKSFKQITNQVGTNEFPYWAGDNVYFVNMQGNSFSLMRVSANGGNATRVAGPYPFEIKDLNGDDKRLIYQKGQELEVFDIATGKTSAVRFEMPSDTMHMRVVRVPATANAGDSSLSKTGKRVLSEARGQIVSLPVGEGASELWMAKDGMRLRTPRMSPDGVHVAYLSDEGGEQQLWIADADGRNPRQVTKDGKRRLVNYVWSPDSKWIGLNDSNMKLRLINVADGSEREINHAYATWTGTPFDFSPDSKWMAYVETDGITGYGRIALYDIANSTKHPLGTAYSNDTLPAFSTDGKYLAFLSARNFVTTNDPFQNQVNTKDPQVVCLLVLDKDGKSPFIAENPVEADPPKVEPAKADPPKTPTTKLDLDGLWSRQIVLPIAPGTYTNMWFVADRLLVSDGTAVSFYDVSKKAGGAFGTGSVLDVSADGKKALLSGMRVVDVAGKDHAATAGRLDAGGLTLRIDPAQEYKQIFWDAWRHLRDYFYVENMHGNDWDAIGRKYSPFLSRVRSRDELDELIRWMQAELGSSHQYLSVGDEQKLRSPVAGSFLGVDLVADPSGYYKIAKILRGDGLLTAERSPLAEPGLGVSEGDFLIAVSGVPARVGSDFLAGLVGRAGKTVSLVVNSVASMEGARTVYVKPVANENRMRLVDWIETNRRYVDEKSGGKVGYVYLAAMGNGDVSDLIRQFYPQRNKEAMLIDTRFNNGGWTQSIIIDILDEKLSGFFNMRNSEYPWSRQQDWFLGPKACLINEFNVSCGEEFPHRWRDLGLGPIIGRRTYGGEVGSSPGWGMVDGGVVSVPNYGMYTLKDGWIIEGEGVKPDIDVPSDPNAFVLGVDPQVDRAIAVLLEEVRKNPRPDIRPPRDRVRIGGGG
ncbi:MAG: S41 family peptidase [Fimbriimonadaceae bacterium]